MGSEGIVDSHTHVHPTPADAVAFRRCLGHGATSLAGDTDEALAVMERMGVRRMVLLPLVHGRFELARRLRERAEAGEAADEDAIVEGLRREWSAYNAWAQATARAQPDRFTAMVAVDPVACGQEWARAEIERGLAGGAAGLKIMPVWIGCSPADERMRVVWELADAHGVPVVSMCGRMPGSDAAHPDEFEAVASAYPRAKVILAHAGLGAEDRAARLARAYRNVYADTSAWFDERLVKTSWHNTQFNGGRAYSLEDAADVIRAIGVDRVLYGTNYAIRYPERTLVAARALPLSAAEREQLFRENYRTVFEDPS